MMRFNRSMRPITYKFRDSPYGGRTQWNKRKVSAIAAPMNRGAYARTIRIHETLHANYSKAPRKSKYPPVAENAIEDARVHSVYWPRSMPRKANRDCLAAALSDMRSIPPMALLGRAEDWNNSLLVALRAMAILSRLGCTTRHVSSNRARLHSRIVNAFGPIVADKLEEILGKVKTRRGKALAAFTALLRSDEEEQRGNGKQPGKGSNGKQTANPMRIVKLAMPQACNRAVKRTALRAVAQDSTAPDWFARLRLVQASGLFIRQRYLQGGTYLFDASGSMGLSEDRLNTLCRSVPAATVAYYSGWGDGPVRRVWRTSGLR